MKILTPLVCALSLVLIQSSINAEGLYKWTDARGNTQYGDKPPANSNAKQVNLPKITVIDNYADQWKPLNFNKNSNKEPEEKTQVIQNTYSKLAFLAPKPNQGIRANDGDISAIVSIKPPLKKGHHLIFSIDGKSTGKTKSRTKNFSNLDRGEHAVSVKVVDKKGKVLKSSSTTFNVLRANPLLKNRGNQATRAPQTRTFQNARQQQLQGQN